VASIRLKFVKAYVDRHGKARHYFRKPACKPVALPGLVGSDEFMEPMGRRWLIPRASRSLPYERALGPSAP
jgi:hypothetical protein